MRHFFFFCNVFQCFTLDGLNLRSFTLFCIPFCLFTLLYTFPFVLGFGSGLGGFGATTTTSSTGFGGFSGFGTTSAPSGFGGFSGFGPGGAAAPGGTGLFNKPFGTTTVTGRCLKVLNH